MISSVAPIRSSTFYAYLITKIGNRNLKILLQMSPWGGGEGGLFEFSQYKGGRGARRKFS